MKLQPLDPALDLEDEEIKLSPLDQPLDLEDDLDTPPPLERAPLDTPFNLDDDLEGTGETVRVPARPLAENALDAGNAGQAVRTSARPLPFPHARHSAVVVMLQHTGLGRVAELDRSRFCHGGKYAGIDELHKFKK